ncbi:membrane protein [Longispora fulva]|uniref:RND superfamily putative drug exporter n=1 Tax=Longispora fulva TaxID=619741 RepID=A0A8J7GEL8_9ACTN|nr:MMPL family transporter [Longispora fulva]MBG6135112.1 RND superfamily putative drug exporter [Longispora fulva]GIG56653.1 membrane protein [Longispora fulva]
MVTKVGSFCYRNWRWVLLGWLALLVGGGAAIGPVFDSIGDTKPPQGLESVTASQVVKDGGDRGIQIIGLVEGVDPTSAQVTDAVKRASADLRVTTGVLEVGRPIVANDNRGLAVPITLTKMQMKDRSAATKLVKARLAQLRTEIPGSTVEAGGDLISGEANAAVQEDLGRSELISLPITLIVLVFVFGGVLAAGLPILASLATIAGAFAMLLGFSKVVDLDNNVVTVVTLLGLALAIDYGLLLVARFREELSAGHARDVAVGRAWGTAGRTILFSALTVAGALTGLLVFDVPRLQALGAAGISTALMGMVAALTLTPALLGAFGRWIRPGRRQKAAAASAAGPLGSSASVAAEGHNRTDASGPRGGEAGFFAGLARFTQRRPLLIAAGTTIALLAVAAPLLSLTVRLPGLEGLPRTLPSVRVADAMSARYGLSAAPAVKVVARTDQATLDLWAGQWQQDRRVVRVEPAKRIGPNLSSVAIAVKGDAQGRDAQDLVVRIRAARPAGVESWVGGDAALLLDLLGRLEAGLPWAVGVMLATMCVLLFLMTGSVVIPVKAIVMNALSLAATFGVLLLVFQDGHLSGPLDTLTVGGLSPFVIAIVAAFGFGLSMDYELFLLGRIKEYRDAGEDSDTAVRHGLQRSGGIITSAALLMLIVFGCFAAAQVGDIEQIGLGLFVAVLIDATVVRCLLVPAMMTLLGRAAWWAPGPLRRLHDRVGISESEERVPVGV